MVFRKKKGKGKPNEGGKKKLKRDHSELLQNFYCSLTGGTASVECEVKESDPGQHNNAGSLSSGDDAGSAECGERRRPLRKCRLSVGNSLLPTTHINLDKSDNESSERNSANCELHVDNNVRNIGHSPPLYDNSVLGQPIKADVRNLEMVSCVKKTRRNTKANHSVVNFPQGVSVKEENVSNEKRRSKSKEEYNLNKSAENAFSIKEEETNEVPYNTSTMTLTNHESVSKRMYESYNLRDLRVMVTRTKLPSNIPCRLSGAEKVSLTSENVGSEKKSICLKKKTKAKERVKRACSVKSESYVEDLDSSESVQVSDVERENASAVGKGITKKTFPIETIDCQKKSFQERIRTALGRVTSVGSDSSDETQNLPKVAECLTDVKTLSSDKRNNVEKACLVTENARRRRKTMPNHKKNKMPVRRTGHIKSDSSDTSIAKSNSGNVLDVSVAAAYYERGSGSNRIPSLKGNSELFSEVHNSVSAKMSSNLGRNMNVSSATSDEEPDLLPGSDECECVVKRRGSRLKYRITSDDGSDENVHLPSNINSNIAKRKSIDPSLDSVFKKCNDEQLYNPGTRNCGYQVTVGDICKPTSSRFEDLDKADLKELNQLKKISGGGILTSSKSTQTSFHLESSDVDFKVNRKSEKRSVGVQKGMEMTCQTTQTDQFSEVTFEEALKQKWQTGDVGLFSHANGLPNLMLALLDQLKSANNLCTDSSNQELKIVGKVKPPSGTSLEVSIPPTLKDKKSPKSERSNKLVLDNKGQSKNFTNRLPSNKNMLEKNKLPLRLNETQFPITLPEVTSESVKKKLITHEQPSDVPSSCKPITVFPRFLEGLDISVDSSDKGSKSKRERNSSKLVPESVQGNSKFGQTHDQLNPNRSGSEEKASTKPFWKSISASKRRKSSGSESSRSSKGERYCNENLISSSKDKNIGSRDDKCESGEVQKSHMTSYKMGGISTLSTSITIKDSNKRDVLEQKEDAKKCFENGIVDSEIDNDLIITWMSMSNRVVRKIKQSKDGEITGNVAIDEAVERCRVVKAPLDCIESVDDGEKGSTLTSMSLEKSGVDNATKSNARVPKIDLLTYKERKLREQNKRSTEMEETASTSDPSQDEEFAQDIQHLFQGNSNSGEDGQSSLSVSADEVVVKTEVEDSSYCEDGDGDDDADIDAISIYGESEYDLLLNGMCNYQGKSPDDTDLEDEVPPFKSLGEIAVGENIGVTPNFPSKCVIDDNTEMNVGNADMAMETEITDEGVYVINDMSSSSDKEGLKVDPGEAINTEVQGPEFVPGDLMQTSANNGANTLPSKNEGGYCDLKNSIPSLRQDAHKRYFLNIPVNLRALQDNADKRRRIPTVFQGICYVYLRKGSCSCTRFQHKYLRNPVMYLKSMPSWDTFVALRYALKRNFTSFWKIFGVKCINILADRNEGDLFMGILFTYCAGKITVSEWTEILKSIDHCGNCDENCVQQILIHLIVNHLHKGKVVNPTTYSELVDKVASMSCKFRETKLLSEILEVLGRQDFWFATTTLEQLLHRCLAMASTRLGLELCFNFGKLINRLNGISQADSSVISLLKELINVLQAKYEILADSIKEKIMGNDSFNNPSQQNETTVSVLGEQGTLHAELIEKRRELLKRQNSNPIEDSPSKKLLVSSLQCNSVNSPRDFNHTDFQSHGINQNENCDLLPQCEYFVPEISTSTLTDDLMSNESQLSSKCSLNVPALTNYSRVDEFNDEEDVFPLSTVGSCHSSSSGSDRTRKTADFENHIESDTCVKVLSTVSSVNIDGTSEFSSNYIEMDVDQVAPVECLPDSSRELVNEDQSSTQFSPLSDLVSVDQLQVEFSSEEEEELEKSDDLDQSYPAQETMNSLDGCSSQPVTYSEVFKKKYNTLLPLPNALKEVQVPPEDITLEEVIKKKLWSPSLMLRFFSPCFTSADHEKNVVATMVSLLEKDLVAAFPMVKAVVNCLESKAFIEFTNIAKYVKIKNVINTLVFNAILKMILAEMWAEAYNLLNVASDAGLPLIKSEGYINDEKMSQSRKILVLSEICFRVDRMKEAIHYLRVGNLFSPSPSDWSYDSYEGDVEIRVTFLTTLICKLALGGYSDLAPETYLEVYRCQNGLLESVDLPSHANKVIICALNAGFSKLAHEVYSTLPEYDSVLPKVTLRALLYGLVVEDQKHLAREIYRKMCQIDVYPLLLEKQLVTEILIKSFWLKEEIFMVVDDALRVLGSILLVDQPMKYKEPDFSISLLVQNFEVPDELDVLLKLDDDSEKDPVPYCLTLQSYSVQRAVEEVTDVLENMLVPAIMYEVVTAEDREAKRVILKKTSLMNHLISAEVKSEGYH